MNNHQLSTNSLLVSVIIPAYNAEAFVEKTLNSVLSQTYENIEVLVVDDGSQDQTVEIVKSIAQQDQRVTLLQQSNSGVATARNLAIQNSKGEFIAPIDADDIWYPNNLEQQVKCITQSDVLVGLVYSWSVEIDEEDLLCGGFHASDYQGNVYTALLNQYFIGNASATLIRRACLEEVGRYNCSLRAQDAQGCEDWDLYLRIAERYQVNVVPEFLVGYRQITNSMSQNYLSMARSQRLVLMAAQERRPQTPAAIYRWSISRFRIYLAQRSSQNGNFLDTLLWLKKAFTLDPSMVLLRHELYLLILQVLSAQFIHLTQPRNSCLTQRSHTQSNQDAKLEKINRMIKIREFLPATLYEKVRLMILTSRVNGLGCTTKRQTASTPVNY